MKTDDLKTDDLMTQFRIRASQYDWITERFWSMHIAFAGIYLMVGVLLGQGAITSIFGFILAGCVVMYGIRRSIRTALSVEKEQQKLYDLLRKNRNK